MALPHHMRSLPLVFGCAQGKWLILGPALGLRRCGARLRNSHLNWRFLFSNSTPILQRKLLKHSAYCPASKRGGFSPPRLHPSIRLPPEVAETRLWGADWRRRWRDEHVWRPDIRRDIRGPMSGKRHVVRNAVHDHDVGKTSGDLVLE